MIGPTPTLQLIISNYLISKSSKAKKSRSYEDNVCDVAGAVERDPDSAGGAGA